MGKWKGGAGPGSQKEMVADLQRVAARVNASTATQDQYKENGRFSIDAVVKAFGSWVEALRKAGLVPQRVNWEPAECLLGIGVIAQEIGHLPTYGEYKQRAVGKGLPCVSAVESHFKTWSKALETFQKSPFAIGERPESETWRSVTEEETSGACSSAAHVYGERTGFDLMPHAPRCENAVLVLFGMLAAELGISAEAIRPAYPDCSAKRWNPRTKEYEQVLVEFELRSGNFIKHRHPIGEKTLVICWEDDWKNPPAGIEVLSLRDHLARRKGGVAVG